MEETDAFSDVQLGLDLGLGLTKYEPKIDNSKKNKKLFFLDLSIPLHGSDLDRDGYSSSSSIGFMQEDRKQTRKNGIFSGCKEGDHDMNYSNDCSRKKLRLSKEQITFLEDSFGQHSTLTMAQKQALAEKLNLKSRQVEVWFQNRRARTKLKQIERDCEFLKKKFERLSDENRRLHNQLLEFSSAAKMEKIPPPPMPVIHTSVTATAPSLPKFFHQVPKESAICRTCPTCEKILKSGGDNSGGRKKEAAAVDVGYISYQ
ncbi:homeobox-leucine zipper protein HOX19-like [Primulina tabacum]|uniref:homeobox-leucine zipper protein HOX19-like n=1 Tax=Primulina tabacum TaxID=48773 RepID=UPI003F59910E